MYAHNLFTKKNLGVIIPFKLFVLVDARMDEPITV